MKRILTSMIIIITFISCENEVKNTNQIEKTNNKSVKKPETKEILPQYENIKEMLKEASDFHEEDGSLKFISEDESSFHVQISEAVLEAESEKLKEEIVKRGIVYIVFQSFAQTDIEELTVTAVPNDWENRKKYYNKYKKTVKVSRTKAKSILKKYLNNEDFSVLYKKEGKLWFPNKNFSKLRFEKLDVVFYEMIN